MDRSTIETENHGQWGVVYSYGSVLAVFDSEQDAQNEATLFGGAVISLARQVWNATSEAALAASPIDQQAV